jgi:hypothetical protein
VIRIAHLSFQLRWAKNSLNGRQQFRNYHTHTPVLNRHKSLKILHIGWVMKFVYCTYWTSLHIVPNGQALKCLYCVYWTGPQVVVFHQLDETWGLLYGIYWSVMKFVTLCLFGWALKFVILYLLRRMALAAERLIFNVSSQYWTASWTSVYKIFANNSILLVTQNLIGSFDFSEVFYILYCNLPWRNNAVEFSGGNNISSHHTKSAFFLKLFIK